MFDPERLARRLVGAAVLGVAFAAAPVMAALTNTPAQVVAEPSCVGSESIVDGTPTCVPAPVPPEAPTAGPGAPVDTQRDDGGHH
ncbi:hypothetical protein [Mycolicibacterium gadium]|jgi:hypothetical protein|uniref:Uncharacterized protein n=1 Tax=Mycolicibacterium gadium TaxID=1794 RepID=A0A7I7WV89_MYCGU|nr:hypothetical protein [Mycolicibacterium gadium]BBZ20383.1 hypothetical protein MGAD_47180 [Mycolicibacterium gadium]